MKYCVFLNFGSPGRIYQRTRAVLKYASLLVSGGHRLFFLKRPALDKQSNFEIFHITLKKMCFSNMKNCSWGRNLRNLKKLAGRDTHTTGEPGIFLDFRHLLFFSWRVVQPYFFENEKRECQIYNVISRMFTCPPSGPFFWFWRIVHGIEVLVFLELWLAETPSGVPGKCFSNVEFCLLPYANNNQCLFSKCVPYV